MSKYTYTKIENVKLRMKESLRDSWGRQHYQYRLIVDDVVIAEGNEFSAPVHATPKHAAMSLLGFLTTKPGDTDEEFFASHTPEHLAWLKTASADNVALIVYDYEGK